jgi:hypothetical protein
MLEENITLKEVVINPKDNPANEIIRNAIKNKKINAEKSSKYTADFYSRGIFRVKNLPKKILGQKLDFFDEIIDSSRSGILYLSETVSKVTFQKPDKLKEVIVASKVSGNDNGFSFNNASSANFDFYDNYFASIEGITTPFRDPKSKHVFHQYTLQLDGIDRDGLSKYLAEQGIPSMIYYPIPAHKQKMFESFGCENQDLPVTDWLTKRVLSLPIHTELDKEQLNYICAHVVAYVNNKPVTEAEMMAQIVKEKGLSN